MRRWVRAALAVSLLATAAACDNDSPTDPSDETATFTAQLSPANEVPLVMNAEASGSGSVTITMHLMRDAAGTLTAATADFAVTLTGFPTTTQPTMAHIHPGAVGVNGGILVNTGLVPGEVTLVAGAGSFMKTGVSVPAADAQNILNGPASFYFNVHTLLNEGGAVRGQLVRQ
jgi:hypothetical protein